VPALASFNIGVEVGQIGVVLIVLPLLLMTDKIFTRSAQSAPRSGLLSDYRLLWRLLVFVRVAELG
jgi:hypothetical protein